MKIRAKTLQRWLLANFSKLQLRDIARYGANNGWYSLIFYTGEVRHLYARFKQELWEEVVALSEAMGCPNPLAFLGSLTTANGIVDVSTLEVFVVYLVIEQMAYRLTEGGQDDDVA